MHITVSNKDGGISVDPVFIQADVFSFVLGIIQQKVLVIVQPILRKRKS